MKKAGLMVCAGILFSTFLNAQIDKTHPLYNSMKTWDEGAFNMNQKGHPDYGWGIYNSVTHGLEGSMNYVIKFPNSTMKRIFITSKNSVGNIYTFKYSEIDGQNAVTKEIRCVDYASGINKKLFVYYSIQNNILVDREPAFDKWDFVLTRYHDNIINYNVTGFLLNEKLKACVYKAPDENRALTSTLADTTKLSDSLTIIGNSWYTLNGMNIVPNKKNVYFVKTDPDTIYKMIVNFFESGASGLGRVGIQNQLLAPTTGPVVFDTLVMGSGYANDVYYHFKNKTVKTVLRNNWDMAFKINAYSASILANTTIGDSLFIYPNWFGTTIAENYINATKIYPNPSFGPVYFQNQEWEQDSEVRVQIYNLSGQAVLSRKQSLSGKELVLDLSELPVGLYQSKIESKGRVYCERILITR
jgi:hypothetical protein